MKKRLSFQSAVPYATLIYPAREHKPLLPCHLRPRVLIRPSPDTSVLC